MIKEVPCMECDGKGFIAKFGEYSVWSERCPNCGGTGTVKVPMTNADRLLARAEAAEKERDAAVSDLETIMAYGGRYLDTCQFCKNNQCYARGGTKLCLPEWRGQKEG